MASYKVQVLASAAKEFEHIPFPARRSVNHKLVSLQRDPRPPGTEQVGEGERYALGVAGWVVLYEIDAQARIVRVVSFQRAVASSGGGGGS